MSIWLLLWLFLSVTLLGFMFWTLYISYKQRASWKLYAEKRKLRYTAKGFLASPEINGALNGYTVALFTGEHDSPDGKGSRKLTALEVHLHSEMPFDFAVASQGMVSFAQRLKIGGELKPQDPNWSDEWIATAENIAALESYLAPERVKALKSLAALKNAWVIFIARGDLLLLRLDTPEPFTNPKAIDDLFRSMLQAVKAFELAEGEGARLKTAVLKTSTKEIRLDMGAESDTGLQLEDAEESEEPEQKETSEPLEKPESSLKT